MIPHRVPLVVIDACRTKMCHGAAMARNKSEPGHRLQRLPAPPLPGKQQIRNGRPDEKYRRNQPFRQQRQRHRGPRPINHPRPVIFEAHDQRVERNQQKQRQNRLRNNEPRKQKRPHRRQHAQPGVQARALAPCPPRPQPRQPRQPQHGQRIRQVRGKGVLAKNLVHAGHHPIGQRRLLNVANPVGLRRDQVAAFRHVLGCLRMRRVHVVHQRRRKQRRKVDGDEDGRKQQPHRARPRHLQRPVERRACLLSVVCLCVHPDFGSRNQNTSRFCAAFHRAKRVAAPQVQAVSKGRAPQLLLPGPGKAKS